MDLREVSFIDSTGLGVLTSLLRAARAMDGDVRLVLQPDALIRNTLLLVRFSQLPPAKAGGLPLTPRSRCLRDD